MIKLIVVGKLKEQYLVNMVEDYKKRINKYHKLEIVEINDDGIEKEGSKILEKLSKKSFKVALTIKGQKPSSPEFARRTLWLQMCHVWKWATKRLPHQVP